MRVIKTKFIGPSNTKGSRVKAYDDCGNSVTLSWDHALDPVENHVAAREALSAKLSLSFTVSERD